MERPIVVALFGRYVVALPLHNMPPKKRKQADSDAEINHVQLAVEHISHCTMEELKLVMEAVRRRQDRIILNAAAVFNPGDTVTWTGKRGVQSGTVTKINQKIQKGAITIPAVAVTSQAPNPKNLTISVMMLKKVTIRDVVYKT